jgi:hypothetical protein
VESGKFERQKKDILYGLRTEEGEKLNDTKKEEVW